MKALITGATSGIGKAIAQELSRRGVSLILTGRNENALLQMQETLPVHTEIIALDLAENQAPFTLYEKQARRHPGQQCRVRRFRRIHRDCAPGGTGAATGQRPCAPHSHQAVSA